MKKRSIVCAALLALCGGCGSVKETVVETGEAAFVGEGTGRGYRGPVSVRVEAADGVILRIEVLEHQEDAFVGDEAIERLLDLVLETNSTEVDAVSGATESSRGFLEAVENALAGMGESRWRRSGE
jgi:uncharacterized protein with FMN-binding domain